MSEPPMDGRQARRERNRAAVLATMIELLRTGEAFPNLQELADRAGVSLRSVHRYFEDADDVVVEAVAGYLDRQVSGFGFVRMPGDAPLPERIERWVSFRIAAQGIAQMSTVAAIARANRSPRVATAIEAARRAAVEALGDLFAPELDALEPAERAGTLAMVHSLTTIESWDNLVNRHGLDDAALHTAWTRLLTAALSAAR